LSNTFGLSKGEGKSVHMHAVMPHRDNGGTAPLILLSNTLWVHNIVYKKTRGYENC